MTEDSETAGKASKLPGGEYKPKPIEINGVLYDGFHPPKEIQRPDGTVAYIGGRKLDRDQVYAERFWQKQPKGKREVMIENIPRMADNGFVTSFVSQNGLSEEDREKLSAMRVLAKELGYDVGQFTFDSKTHIAKAPISKVSVKTNQ